MCRQRFFLNKEYEDIFCIMCDEKGYMVLLTLQTSKSS